VTKICPSDSHDEEEIFRNNSNYSRRRLPEIRERYKVIRKEISWNTETSPPQLQQSLAPQPLQCFFGVITKNGLSQPCGIERSSEQGNIYFGPVERQPHPRPESFPLLVDSRCSILVAASKAALQDIVFERGRVIGTHINKEIYFQLEERMLYGGSGRLSLVYDDFDYLRWQYSDDDESYSEAIRAFQTDYQIEYKDLRCFLASEEMLIFLNGDGADRLIYGFDLNEWNLLILGEESDWIEALEMHDAWVGAWKTKALIAATEANRSRYRAGWRPSPLPDGRLYE
jgi:hypothetical protein